MNLYITNTTATKICISKVVYYTHLFWSGVVDPETVEGQLKTLVFLNVLT